MSFRCCYCWRLGERCWATPSIFWSSYLLFSVCRCCCGTSARTSSSLYIRVCCLRPYLYESNHDLFVYQYFNRTTGHHSVRVAASLSIFVALNAGCGSYSFVRRMIADRLASPFHLVMACILYAHGLQSLLWLALVLHQRIWSTNSNSWY